MHYAKPTRFILLPLVFSFLLSIWCNCAKAELAARLEGQFAPSDGAFDRKRYENLKRNLRLWDSWHHSDANMGKLRLGPFKLQTSFTCYVANAAGWKGTILAWEDCATGERCVLEPRSSPDNRWVLYHWQTPEKWRGRSVYFVAEDNSPAPGCWIGVSEPLEGTLVLEPVSTIGLWYPIVFIIILLPGVAWASWRYANIRSLEPENWLSRVMVASAITAYILFFIYFAHPVAGKFCTWLILIGSIVIVAKYRKFKLVDIPRHPLMAPVSICFFAGLLYTAILLAYGGANAPHLVSMNRYLYTMPPDTILPYWMSERLHEGTPLKPFLSEWLSSDRPPLQAAFHLITSPFAPRRISYQLMSTALQCWVFLAIWILLRRASVRPKTIAWILFACVFSGFFLFNGTFVWPKLLPAAFLLIAASGLLFSPREPASLSGSCAALAMLGHGGSAFGLAGIIVASLIWPPERRYSYWVKTAAVGIILMLPWTLYQKLYDPPGNRLLKWHLAGAVPVDSRPLGQTILDAYKSKPLGEVFQAKCKNAQMLFYDFDALHKDWQSFCQQWNQGHSQDAFVFGSYRLREACFFHFMQSPELLIIGLAGIGLIYYRRKTYEAECRVIKVLGVTLLAALAAWCLLMFEPGSTSNHQGSYFNNACLFILLGLGLTALPSVIRWFFSAILIIWFAIIWAYAAPRAMNTAALLPSADPLVTTLGVLATISIIYTLGRLSRAKTNPPSIGCTAPCQCATANSSPPKNP